MKKLVTLLCVTAALWTTPGGASDLEVSVITVKKFTVNPQTGGVKIPPGADSFWDFLEIGNKDQLPAVIVRVDGLMGLGQGCVISNPSEFPVKLPPKLQVEYTIRQGCAVGGVAIDLDVGQQRYLIVAPLIRLAAPVLQAAFRRSN